MNSEAESLSSVQSPLPGILGIHPGIAAWDRDFTEFVGQLSEFIAVDTTGTLGHQLSSTPVATGPEWRGTLCCGLAHARRAAEFSAQLRPPLIIFVGETEANGSQQHAKFIGHLPIDVAVEQRLEACSIAAAFIVPSPRLRAYVAGWVVQAGRVPTDKNFVIVYDPENPAPCIHKVLEILRTWKPQPPSSPYFGSVSGKPAFLRIASDSVVALKSGNQLQQSFVIPAENVAGIRLHLTPPKDELPQGRIELALRNARGRIITKGNASFERSAHPGADPGQALSFELRFPALQIPAGGTEVLLELVYRNAESPAKSSAKSPGESPAELRLPATSRCGYPLVGGARLNEAELGKGLSLEFLPADSTVLYRIQVLTRRAISMARRGELRRVGRALVRRLPEVSGMIFNRLQQQLRRLKK